MFDRSSGRSRMATVGVRRRRAPVQQAARAGVHHAKPALSMQIHDGAGRCASPACGEHLGRDADFPAVRGRQDRAAVAANGACAVARSATSRGAGISDRGPGLLSPRWGQTSGLGALQPLGRPSAGGMRLLRLHGRGSGRVRLILLLGLGRVVRFPLLSVVLRWGLAPEPASFGGAVSERRRDSRCGGSW
jgi:hypothetical protein